MSSANKDTNLNDDKLPTNSVPDAKELLAEIQQYHENNDSELFCEKLPAFLTAILREFFLLHFQMLLRSRKAEEALSLLICDGCSHGAILTVQVEIEGAVEWFFYDPRMRARLLGDIDHMMNILEDCDIEVIRQKLNDADKLKLRIKHVGENSIRVGDQIYSYNYEIYASEGADEQNPGELSTGKVDENIRKRHRDSELFNESGGSSSSSSSADRQKLFAELNKGEVITFGKVTDDIKTDKNPLLRAQGTVSASLPFSKSSGSSPAAKPKPVDRPPKTELKDHKVWNVEYHKDNENIVLNTDVKQAVYVFRCERSVIQIKGKVNSVTLDGCKKTSVVFDNLLTQVEVINSQGIKVQTLGTMPTISIQKTDGCQVYLSKDSLDAEIVISKSSEIKVLAPCGEDGDFMEFPVPEQLKVTLSVEKKKLNTVVSDIV